MNESFLQLIIVIMNLMRWLGWVIILLAILPSIVLLIVGIIKYTQKDKSKIFFILGCLPVVLGIIMVAFGFALSTIFKTEISEYNSSVLYERNDNSVIE